MLYISKILKSLLPALFVTLSIIFLLKYVLPDLEEIQDENYEYAVVINVIDGDTYEAKIGNSVEKIRLIGIDTPEKYENYKLYADTQRTKKNINTIKRLGNIASDYAEKLVKGKKVKLVKEIQGDERDKYGRLLRYVYLEDGTFVNLKLIKDGYANVYTKYDYSLREDFISAERYARENKLGLWSDSLSDFK
jgi:micrococcal nuclease